MMKDSFNKKELAQLLPHSGTMCLLDSIEHWDERKIIGTATSHLDRHNPLREKGKLYTFVGLEYASQVVAIHGQLCRDESLNEPRLGYLVSVSNVKLENNFLDEKNMSLVIKAKLIIQSGYSSVYQVDITYDQGEVILTGQLTVFLHKK